MKISQNILVLILVVVVNGQIYDHYTIYSPNQLPLAQYYKPVICSCPNTCLTNNNTNPNYITQDLSRQYVYTSGNASFKLVLTSCDPVIINTDHYNRIYYSFDTITWESSKGLVSICPMIGELYVRIEYELPTRPARLRFKPEQYLGCNNSVVTTDNLLTVKQYVFNLNQTSFGLMVNSTCEVINYVGYYNNNTTVEFTIESHFAVHHDFQQSFTVILTVEKKTQPCIATVYTTSQVLLDTYTNRVNFMDNTNLPDLVVPNTNSYNISYKGNITVNGYYFTSPSTFVVPNMDNKDVYNTLKQNTLQYSAGYYTLYRYYEGIVNEDTVINSSFVLPESGNLFLNSIIVTLEIMDLPVNLTVNHATLVIPQPKLVVNSINMTGTNTLVMNSSSIITVKGCSNFAGNLNLNVVGYNTSVGNEYVVMEYQNYTGSFDNITTKTTDECTSVTSTYTQSQLIIAFSLNTKCDTDTNNGNVISGDEDNSILIYYIIIPIVGIVIIFSIVLIIVVLKVKCIRKKLFPYRDRKHFKSSFMMKPIN